MHGVQAVQSGGEPRLTPSPVTAAMQAELHARMQALATGLETRDEV